MANPNTNAAGLTMNAAQMGAVLRQVSNTSPIAAEAIEQACRTQGGDIARVRNGLLYSTSAIAIGAGGTAAGTSCTLFNVGIGQADPLLGALTKAQTNMISGGSLKNRAFQAQKLGFRVFYATNVGAAIAADTQEAEEWFLNNCSVDFRLGAQDVQTLGNLNQWPSAGSYPNGVVAGTVAAPTGALSAGAGFAVNGYDDVLPYDLAIPAETSISMNVTLQAPFVPTGAAPPAANLAIQACFYGYDITAIQG